MRWLPLLKLMFAEAVLQLLQAPVPGKFTVVPVLLPSIQICPVRLALEPLAYRQVKV